MDDRASDPAESGRTVAHVHEGFWIQDRPHSANTDLTVRWATYLLAKSQVHPHINRCQPNSIAGRPPGLGSDGIFLNPESSSHRSLPACQRHPETRSSGTTCP